MASIGIDTVTILPDFSKYRAALIAGVKSSGSLASQHVSKQITDGMTKGLRQSTKEAGKHGESAGKAFGDKFDKGFSKSKGISGALKRIQSMRDSLDRIRLTALIAGLATVATSLVTISTAASAGAIALPSFISAWVAGTATLNVGFANVGKGIKAIITNDAEALEKALEKLSPQAKKFVVAFQGAFKPVREAVQDKLFENLHKSIDGLAKNGLPVINKGMLDVASATNANMKAAMDFGQTPLAKGALTTTFKLTSDVMRQASTAVEPLLKALARLVIFADPLTRDFANWAIEGAKAGAEFINSEKGANKLSEMVKKVSETFKTLGSIGKNLTLALGNIFKASNQDGEKFLDTLDDLTERFEKWTGSVEGQKELGDTFKALNNIFIELSNILPLVLTPITAFAKAISGLSPETQELITKMLAWVIVIGSVGGKVVHLGIIMWKTSSAIKGVVTGVSGGIKAMGGFKGAAGKMAKAAKGLFTALTAGVRALTTAMLANPIFLIVAGIAALVAGLIWAYHNVEWFRNGVNAVWNAISAAVKTAWENYIKPVVTALVNYWNNTLAPAIIGFWNNKVKPAWNGFIAIVKAAWNNHIKPALDALVNFWNTTLAPAISGFYNDVVKPTWDKIVAVITWAWNFMIRPTLDTLVWFWNYILAPVFRWLYDHVIKPAFTAIGAIISFIWNSVIKPTVTALVNYWNDVLSPTISWLYNNVIKPVWDKIGEIIKHIWEKIILPAVQAIVDFWNNKLAPTARALYDNVIKPTWDKIGEIIKNVWENIILVAFNKMGEGLDTLKKAFENAKTGIGKIWEGLKDLIKAPVRFIIETVWNNGIVALSNKIHSVIKAVPILPKVELPKGFADGGIYQKGFASGGTYLPAHNPSSVLPGYSPGKDNMLVPLAGGESILRPEFSKFPEWRQFVSRGNAAARSGGVSGAKSFLSRGYADGGIVGVHPSGMPVSSRGLFLGGVFDWFGDTVGKVTGTLGGIVEAFKKNLASDVVAKLFDGIFGPVNELGKRFGWAGKVGGETMMQMKDNIVNWFLSFLTSGGGEGAEAVLNVARKEIGTTEPGNKKYNDWYGLDVSQPWCDMFVSWCAAQAKEGAAVGKFAYTPTHADFFAQRKQWHQGAAGAAPGDIVFFDWGGGSSRSGIDHVGFVEKANGGTLTTIEGNTSDAVKRMTRSGSSITGYGRPAYTKNGSGSGDNVGNGKYNGKAFATFFWDPQTADGGGMRNNTVASPTWPLGTQVRLGWDGRFVSGEVHDFGPADWVIRRNNMKQMVDLATPLSRALFGEARNGDVSFAVTHVGSGATYMGRKPQWGSSLTLDQGGWMKPFAPYMNLSGRPEPVFNASQWSRIERLVHYVDREAGVGQTGGDVNVYVETNANEFRIAERVATVQRRARNTKSFPPAHPARR